MDNRLDNRQLPPPEGFSVLLERRRMLMSGQSKGEYVEYPDAYKMVFVLTEQTDITPFTSQTAMPTKVVVDGVEITAAKTFTLQAGTHTVYYWVNPWATSNSYSGSPASSAAQYMVEYRLPTFEGCDVTTNFHNLFWFTPNEDLAEITCLSQTPPNFGSGTNRNAALRASAVKKIRVPIEVLNDYKTADYWSVTAVKNKLVGVKFDLGT